MVFFFDHEVARLVLLGEVVLVVLEGLVGVEGRIEADQRKVVFEEVGHIGRSRGVLPVSDYLRSAFLYFLHLLSFL